MQHFQRHFNKIPRCFCEKNKSVFKRTYLRNEFSVSQSLPLSSYPAFKCGQHSSYSDEFPYKNGFTTPLLAFGIMIASCAQKEDDENKNQFYGKLNKSKYFT